MAGDAAELLDLQQHHVVVAIQPDFSDVLHVAGLLALAPQFVARARKVNAAQRARSFFQRLAVHPRHHEDFPGGGILRDRRHQALGVPFDGIEPVAHRRTSIPCCFMYFFASSIPYSPKWKMLAASTASARPSFTPSTRCCRLPTPPLAMMGMSTASEMARVSSRSKPLLVPSRSIEVSSSSPAPRPSIFFAHSIASSPVALRPPWVNTSQWSPMRLASIATTMHWLP